MNTIALIDADIVAYRTAASCEPSQKRAAELGIPFEELAVEPLNVAIQRADELMYRILNTTQSQEYRAFISGGDNFRYTIYPEYKANREGKRRPTHLEAVKNFLIEEWKAEVTCGYEADDAIGIHCTPNSIICSIDKDLLQIPGMHYNFVKDEFEDIVPSVALRNYYKLLLMGDRSDNIPGVSGIGEVKSEKLLIGRTIQEMEQIIEDYYDDKIQLEINRKLIRVLRSEEEYQNILSQSEGPQPTEGSGLFDSKSVSNPIIQ